MLCESILGKQSDPEFAGCLAVSVEIPWHDAFKKLHRLTASDGTEVGIRLGDVILTRGLQEGDVLGRDGNRIVVVAIPACETIVIEPRAGHDFMLVKAAYEIGNRHAPLFWGETAAQLVTVYNEPMHQMLERLHGLTVHIETRKLDFDQRISSAVHGHTHE